MGSLDSEPASPFTSPATSPGSIEKTQNRSTPGRRQRPPELHLDHAGDQTAGAAGPSNRKESRIGLRNLFGRSKVIMREDNVGLGNLASPTTAARFAGIQPSVTDMGTRPYAKTTANLNAVLSMDPVTESPSTSTESQEATASPLGMSRSHGPPRRKAPTSKAAKSALKTPSAADAPPLFKAFQLATRYATLPAMTSQSESLLRMNEKRDAYAAVFEAFEDGDENVKAKKKHRRHPSGSFLKLEWTNKIYVLASSGFVFQYATEGPFDRLPEKVLRLKRDSAAFASDVIPGRHWVLQVTTSFDLESPSAAEPRSIFSRIGFRHVEKRNATQLLMVFENGEDMGSWMATLRAEIERLTKDTPETGGTVSDDSANALRGRLSQQTLIVRDSQLYLTGTSRTPSSYANSDRPMSEGSITVTDTDPFHDTSKDDASMTNSTVSHEGRQLESLRDSAHRLSYLSIGQRTAVTSAGSSPIGSPTLGYFPQSPTNLETSDPNALLRPNVAEIMSKRMLSETHGALEDGCSLPRGDQSTTASPPASRPSSGMSSQTPNFSVPSSSARRYSRLPHSDAEPSPIYAVSPDREEAPPRTLPRISSPTSLRSTRPLSLVMDQPLPQDPMPERPVTGYSESRSALSAGTFPVPRLPAEQFRHQSTSIQEVQARRQTLMPSILPGPASLAPRPQPRRLSSMNSVREHETSPVLLEQGYIPIAPGDNQAPAATGSRTDIPPKERPSIYSKDSRRTFSPTSTRRSKRLSIHSMLPDGSVVETEVTSMKDLPPPAAPPPSIALPPLPPNISNATRHSHFIPQHSQLPPALSSSLALKPPPPLRGLLNRRSMPHLAAEGPPPAPPPNCALPPIPQHLARRAMQSRT